MKKVIMIQQDLPEEENLEITHALNYNGNGWLKDDCKPFDEVDKIVYLGNDTDNGDMFAVYIGDAIIIYKGYLNNGKY